MKLDTGMIRYLTKADWRILQAVEVGLKNHELVPVPLIVQIACLRRTGVQGVLSTLLKHKLLAHDSSTYDGYKLTYLGYDLLALRAFLLRGHLVGVGTRVGVGKESDIHVAEGPNGFVCILKLHRLGRISFRSIKRNRDYLGHRQSASWMYMARLAAAKEFAFMKALYENGFPVPRPIDVNRHGVLMEYVDGYPLSQVKTLNNPEYVLGQLMSLMVKMARCGLIHGDFNEFNLMISDDEKITMIDFPQVISTDHPNAEEYFNRDVSCVRNFFMSRFGLEAVEFPTFLQVKIPDDRAIRHKGINLSGIDEEERLKIDCELQQGQVAAEEFPESPRGSDSTAYVDLGDDEGRRASVAESSSSTGSDSDIESDGCGSQGDPVHLGHVWRPLVKRRAPGQPARKTTKQNRGTPADKKGCKRNRMKSKAAFQWKHDM